MAAKKFKKHMMYKGKSAIMANTYEEHLALAEQDYGHTKPKNSKKQLAAYGMKMEKSYMGGGMMKSRYSSRYNHGGKFDRKQYD